MGVAGAGGAHRVQIARGGKGQVGDDAVLVERADIEEIFGRSHAVRGGDVIDLALRLRDMDVAADPQTARLGDHLAMQVWRTGVGRVRPEPPGYKAVAGAVPGLDEIDTAPQPGLADFGMAGIVGAVQFFQPHIEDLVRDLRAQPRLHADFGERFRLVPDVVDRGDAGLDHVDDTERCQRTPLVRRDVLFGAKRHRVERRAAGAVITLAAKHDRSGVAVAIDEARQHGLACPRDEAARRPMAFRFRRTRIDDPVAADRDFAVDDDIVITGHGTGNRGGQGIQHVRPDKKVDDFTHDNLPRFAHQTGRRGTVSMPAQTRHSPPSMTRAWPVMKDERSEARKRAASAISSTLAQRPIGIWLPT